MTIGDQAPAGGQGQQAACTQATRLSSSLPVAAEPLSWRRKPLAWQQEDLLFLRVPSV